MTEISSPPPNVLGFVISTETKAPAYSGHATQYAYERKSYSPQGWEKDWWSRKEFEMERVLQENEELERLVAEEEIVEEGDASSPGSQAWLKFHLEDEDHCAWCANTLCMQFNTVRSGWMVHCTYCGSCGPTESSMQSALKGFLTTSRL